MNQPANPVPPNQRPISQRASGAIPAPSNVRATNRQPRELPALAQVFRKLIHAAFFRDARVQVKAPLVGRGADREGFELDGRIGIWRLETEPGQKPLYRVVLSSELPPYLHDVAALLCTDRHVGGTLVMHEPELIRLVFMAEGAVLAEERTHLSEDG